MPPSKIGEKSVLIPPSGYWGNPVKALPLSFFRRPWLGLSFIIFSLIILQAKIKKRENKLMNLPFFMCGMLIAPVFVLYSLHAAKKLGKQFEITHRIWVHIFGKKNISSEGSTNWKGGSSWILNHMHYLHSNISKFSVCDHIEIYPLLNPFVQCKGLTERWWCGDRGTGNQRSL